MTDKKRGLSEAASDVDAPSPSPKRRDVGGEDSDIFVQETDSECGSGSSNDLVWCSEDCRCYSDDVR